MARLWAKCSAIAAACLLVFSARAQSAAALHETFLNPPGDAKPMMRWWWFGPAVTKEEIAREIDQMHAGGIGGFELASVYPLTLDDPAKGIKNLRYTSPEMVDMLRFAQQHGRSLGMRADLTLGSGWPFGGPHIPIGLAAARLKIVPVSSGSPKPGLQEGESFIAAYSAKGTPEKWDASSARRVTLSPVGDISPGPGASRGDVVVYFILSHTRQMVKRAAVGGEGYVLDHMSKDAIEAHLKAVGDPLLKGFADAPPYAIFSDSLEVYLSDWTPTLPEEFRKRRGYDLLDHLPELVQGGTPQADAVRHDWGETLSDLVRENYLRPMTDYAAQHGTKFRSQTYGEPAATLADERIPQLPEGEGPQWQSFSFTRWASSANHVFGNKVTSAETFTWLHSPVFRATPLDMKAEADRMFLEGVNQVIGHGWPYSAPYAPEPGWSLYAASVFNAHNPWWPVMPAVTKYLQRVSWLLRQGEPDNDVAILLPEDDAQSGFKPGHVSVTVAMQQLITAPLMKSILGAGYNLDYVDAEAIALRGLHHRVLVVPPTHSIPLATAKSLQQYAKDGGKIIFVGELPTIAPGLQQAAESAQVAKLIEALQPMSQHVAGEEELPSALHRALPADLDVSDSHGDIGFLHRRLPNADVYFIANTANETRTLKVSPRSTRSAVDWWNVDTGSVTRVQRNSTITLAPYDSRVLVLHDGASVAAEPIGYMPGARQPIVLGNWHAAFPGSAGSKSLPSRAVASTNWAADDSTKFYSGEARYSTTFTAASLSKGQRLLLHFAEGRPLTSTAAVGHPGFQAWLDAPIRDAATILVNGKPAGVLWHPPYDLDVSKFLKPGQNQLEIRVYNTAVNELAGQPPRDYSALKAKYGDRFQMQDMDKIRPEASGIVGPVELQYQQRQP